jgi:hypothetical protein
MLENNSQAKVNFFPLWETTAWLRFYKLNELVVLRNPRIDNTLTQPPRFLVVINSILELFQA